MPRNRITNINTRSNGVALNSGLITVSEFSLATSVPMQFCETVVIRLANGERSSNDYLANYNHTSQFSIDSLSVITNGSSQNNNFVPRHSQFIAPVDCYVKSINGFINTAGGASCKAEQTFTISVWSKPTTIGSANTIMTLLFSQDFVFGASNNSNALAIDGSTDSKVGDKLYKILAKEGVIVSIKRAGDACANIQATFTMIFETIDNQATLDDFKLNTVSQAFNRYDNTVSNPNEFNLPKYFKPI
tara:strand:+ start:3558 stop:4295 length:738 start_codon:yes stop_codon:yes gene_type:complete